MPSSVIDAMYYDPETLVLTIVYRGNRGVYRYFDVPPEEHAAFHAARSKGTYLNEAFKTRQYRYEKISPKDAGSASDIPFTASVLK